MATQDFNEFFSFATTDELPYAPEIIGQDRAVEAIHFGLDIQSPGFNVFVMGPVGTGRRSTLQRIVRDHEPDERDPGGHRELPGQRRAQQTRGDEGGCRQEGKPSCGREVCGASLEGGPPRPAVVSS